MEILTKYALEILFGLISAASLGFCRHLIKQNQELKKLQEADKNRQYREMILNEIEPIQEELGRLHVELEKVESREQKDCDEIKNCSKEEHNRMYEDLHKVQEETRKNFKLIINSYKFRLIQLCKTHLRDGYISEADFEQITEMYKLYSGLGGNGQAQEYYDKVIQLEIRAD